MKIYAAYGSNMNLKQMARRCPGAKIIGNGLIRNYKLTFKGKGHANIELADSMIVPVVLWEITDKCERALDAYEGYPRYYIKKNITINTNEAKVEAMVYVMSKDYESEIEEPSKVYFNIIFQGYIENKIQVRYLQEAIARNRNEIYDLERERKQNFLLPRMPR